MVSLKIRRQRGRHEEQPSREIPVPPEHQLARDWEQRKIRGEWCHPDHEDMFRALWREFCAWREYVKRQQRGMYL